MRKPKPNHRFGRMTVHHLVPRVRLKDYYWHSFKLPRNKLKIWEFKHAAWHKLFKVKSLNEIIALLKKREDPFGYMSSAWRLLFKRKTKKDVLKLLLRVRRAIRKKYQHLEFDPSLRAKIKKIIKSKNRPASLQYLHRKFQDAA